MAVIPPKKLDIPCIAWLIPFINLNQGESETFPNLKIKHLYYLYMQLRYIHIDKDNQDGLTKT